MAQQTAKLNYLRIAPRKVRLVASALKGLSVQEAEAQLLIRTQRSAPALLKLLRSAVASAKSRNINTDNLIISSVRVDKGPVLKRLLPRAMGRGNRIEKKMSHVVLVLEEAEKPFKPRFNIVVAKKTKKETKPAKKIKEKTKKEEKIPEKQPKTEIRKEGIFKRFFQRKSV